MLTKIKQYLAHRSIRWRGWGGGGEVQNKIILDLCGGTGSWSKPYKDAGEEGNQWGR